MSMQTLVTAFVSGTLLAMIYFASLWWTTRRAIQSAHPVRLICVSLALRGAALLAGLYWLAHGDMPRLIGALLGIVLVRTLAIAAARRSVAPALGNSL